MAGRAKALPRQIFDAFNGTCLHRHLNPDQTSSKVTEVDENELLEKAA